MTSKVLTPHPGLHGRLSVLWLGHCQGCRQEFRNELGGALATDGKVYCEDCWDTNCDQQEGVPEQIAQVRLPEFTETWATKRIQELELEVAFANANYRQALDSLKHEMDKVSDLQEQVWSLQGIAPEEAQP